VSAAARVLSRTAVAGAAGRIAIVPWIPLALAGLALVVRSYRLGTNSIWFDETVSLINAQLNLPNLIDATRADVHPPLYYLLLHAWLSVPVVGTQHPESWARFFSAVCSAGTVGLTYVLGVELLGSRMVGLIAALLVTFSPASVAQGQEARMYPLLGLFTFGALVLLHRALKNDSRVTWVAFGVVCALLPWVHYFGFFVLGALGVVGLVRARRYPPRALRIVLVLSVAGLLFLPWVPNLLAQLQPGPGRFWRPPMSWGLLGDTGYQMTFFSTPDHGWFDDPLTVWGANLYGALVVLGSAALVWRRHVGVALIAVLVVPIALAAALSLWLVPVYEPRYVLFTLPAFALLAACGLTQLRWRWLIVGCLVVVLAGEAVSLQALFTDGYYARPDLRQAAREIIQDFQPGDVILHTALGTQLPVEYYTGPNLPSVEIEPISRSAVQKLGHSYRRVWLVRIEDTDAWGYDIEAEVRSFMADFTLAQKYPLTGLALYEYLSS
jgi:mannosyltransferase